MNRERTLLVIDDDLGFRDYLGALGTSRGFRVATAASGEEALRAVRRDAPDVVTLDLTLTGMDGLATLRDLRREVPDLPVIIISGHGQASNIVAAMRCGASDFLRKPFEAEELDAALRQALEAGSPPREARERGGPTIDSGDQMICGDDAKMREVRDIIDRVAETDITVLIRGESGTGKELIARALHQHSGRRSEPFVKVNCAALPSELLESELFGFEKGAFTGAQRRKLGKFEYANQGTIFLDEISEMPPPLQAKLLQVLQDGQFSPLGGRADVRVNTRVVAATNRDLETAVERGEFRADLFYRLNVVTIPLPPLRDRMGALPLLVEHFRTLYNTQYGRELAEFSERALELFRAYGWPGNVRELENFVKRAVVLGSEDTILEEIARRLGEAADQEGTRGALDLGGIRAGLEDGQGVDLKAVAKQVARVAEKRVIERVLDRTRWNRKEAAKRLRISYKALLYKMKESGLGEAR